MNLLGEFKLKVGSKEKTLKLTNRALYQTQIDLGKKGLMELITGLDHLDLLTIYTLAKNSSVCGTLTMDEVLDSELDLVEIASFLAEQIGVLFSRKKTQPTLETK